MKKKKNKKKNKINRYIPALITLFSCILVIICVTSYGFFTYQRSGKKQNTMYTANLSIIVDDNGMLGINHGDAFPVYDEVGRTTNPYKFTLRNTGSVAANFVMKLVPDDNAITSDHCADNLLAEGAVKFQLIKDGTVVREDTISNLTDYEIDSGFIGLVEGVNKSYDYELRLWIAHTAGKEVMGRHYHGRIDVVIKDPANS